jgi:hypothetical protein
MHSLLLQLLVSAAEVQDLHCFQEGLENIDWYKSENTEVKYEVMDRID